MLCCGTLCAVWWLVCVTSDSDSHRLLFSSAIIVIIIIITDIPLLIILYVILHAFLLTSMLHDIILLIRCNAIRGGITSNILAEELVPGDVIQLMSGDRVPADCRVLMCTGELCLLYALYVASTQQSRMYCTFTSTQQSRMYWTLQPHSRCIYLTVCASNRCDQTDSSETATIEHQVSLELDPRIVH